MVGLLMLYRMQVPHGKRSTDKRSIDKSNIEHSHEFIVLYDHDATVSW